MASDIGTILFVEILRMTQYPGAPFTGSIINDLVLFFFIPTVIIIIFIYVLVKRLVGGMLGNKLTILLGIAMYLFIIYSGLYPVFAYLAGPYLVFLIFIFGVLLFMAMHFRGDKISKDAKTSQASPRERAVALAGDELIEGMPKELRGLVVSPSLNPRERAELIRFRDGLNKRIARLDEQIDKAHQQGSAKDIGHLILETDKMRARRDAINLKLEGSH